MKKCLSKHFARKIRRERELHSRIFALSAYVLSLACAFLTRQDPSRSAFYVLFDLFLSRLSDLECFCLGTSSGKAVLLEDVINNLSGHSDHYTNATLSFVVGEMQHKQLFELFREKRII